MAAADPLIDEIETRRLARRWSVRHLCRLAGISHNPYYDALAGRGGMNVHTLRSLAHAVDLEIRLAPSREDRLDDVTAQPLPNDNSPKAQAYRRRVLNEAMA